ncbi:MAG: hypothetical protein M3174_06875 [Actinomycetota bacterium]|nr:hypothetical protein [Actinomycetota bacterium]
MPLATGDGQPRHFAVFPRLDPRELVENDVDALVRDLFQVPFARILDYLGALERVASSGDSKTRAVADFLRAVPGLNRRNVEIAALALPHLVRPDSVRAAVDRELGDAGAGSGTRYLDEWVPLDAEVRGGAAAQVAARLASGSPEERRARPPRLRAMPTRQLHITAGNSVMTALVSVVRAFATKGAAVIKTTVETAPAMTVLAHALLEADPGHPVVRHTSVAYWPGGDEGVEQPLFERSAFDRVVAWGSEATLRSVSARARAPKLILFRPRVGMSFLGRETFRDALDHVAWRAATDVMIENQHACTSSLVHYVEGSREEALAYCRALQSALRTWDDAMPAPPSRAAVGSLRRLRRGELATGAWFENVTGGAVTSAVVYASQEVDLSTHPMCRLVIVRRVDDLQSALAYVNDTVAAVGVHPEARRVELRDALAARGVSNVCPLGECDRAFAGIPHDGMRPLHDLVSWVAD